MHAPIVVPAVVGTICFGGCTRTEGVTIPDTEAAGFPAVPERRRATGSVGQPGCRYWDLYAKVPSYQAASHTG